MDDDDDADTETVSSKRHCFGCGVAAPPTRSDQTLISTSHGWRLSRRAAGGGEFFLEWRCPVCWKRYKDKILSGP